VPVQPVERKLAAIFAADIAGYSRLMARDEVGTLARLKACRTIIDGLIASHRGRIFNTAGDSVVADFASAVDAVQCAVAVQAAVATENGGGTADEPMQFRVGVHVGDVIVDGDNLLGDGVNIAARLEALAEPGAICVSAATRDHIGNKLPLAFDDLGEQQVKNIAQAIRAYRVQSETRAPPPVAALPLPDKPSLAVLPFQNMSGDPEQEYFADGIVEDITTAIARLPWLFVIARNSSFTYKGKSVDVKQVARELGVRYVLEGSVRKAGDRVRITGQLIDTATGAHIWAEHFDGALDDIFELQDKVASSVVGAIEPRLRASEIERASRKPTERLDAYDLYLRALAQVHKYTEEGMHEAVTLAKRALAIDPSYAPAAAMVGWCRILQRIQGWGAVSEAKVAEAVLLARQAIEAGRDDPEVLSVAGYTIAILAGEPSTALAGVDRALALNPNSAVAWSARGWILGFQNQPDPAIEAHQQAIRLSPFDPLAYLFTAGLALAHQAAGRYEEAIDWADRATHAQPRYVVAMRIKLICLAQLSRTEEARELLTRVLALQPGLTIASWRASWATTSLFSPELLALYVDGLRKAGVPEG
jgi:TolB-like protein/tetratricopeptide (TPR) repeat protein